MKSITFAFTLCAAASVVMAEVPSEHPQATEADRALHSAGSAAALPNIGKVLEIINSGGYTYLKVEDQGNTYWIAGSKIQVFEGDVVSFSKGNTMRNFRSTPLNRTFQEILFTEKILLEGAHPGEVSPTGGQVKIPEGAAQEGLVLSAVDSGGYTYIEVTQGGQVLWLAAPKVAVKKDDTVRYGGGTVMKNFFSKTLKREFTELVFLGGVEVVGK